MAHTIEGVSSRSHSPQPRNRQLVRQWQILRCLAAARAGATYAAIANTFGVSTRTIRRDLAALQEAGFPVVDVLVDEDTGTIGWRVMDTREVARVLSFEVAQ